MSPGWPNWPWRRTSCPRWCARWRASWISWPSWTRCLSGEQAPPFVAGPERVALREDVVDPVPLARPPSEMAPEFIDGFFVVPRLGAMEDA